MSTAPDVRVCIDAGQTSIRVRISGGDGSVNGGGAVREASFPGIRGDRPIIAQIADLIAREDGFGADRIAVGLTGFEHEPEAARHLLDAAPHVQHAVVAHDSVTGYLGANGLAPGAVAAVGTGVVVLGVGPAAVARVDGWGSVLGDDGSAYWIGRAGLQAVLRAHDGRGEPTALSALAVDEFGELDRLGLAVQADPDRVARIARFAPQVTGLADTGVDPVAVGIVDRAAAELAYSIATAVHRAGVAGVDARLSATGQVVGSMRLLERLAGELDELLPGSRLEPALGAPIDGVERLLDLPEGHPLGAFVNAAAR
ncbi:ATPase [Agromyces sp. CFH 90414]|uniref:ATPase n=1 Tax=Agromyces agglutinans TaxID=2662258 RepID=A0A6I2F7I2_9MICO|nr:BadF/BadG/BcrA/BcrD ATPase family protein [Agromyces agglutinans]MRG60732.1 ATPase [Agromyces agglutinans]